MTSIIAECGLCHDGNIDRAHSMIAAAAFSGAAGVKFQKRSAAHWFRDSTPRPEGRQSFGATAGEHRRALELTVAQHIDLRAHARALGLLFGVSVWDIESAVEAMDRIRPDYIKIGLPVVRDNAKLAERIGRLSELPLHVSCSTVQQAAEWGDRGAIVYYCPGHYPDGDHEIDVSKLGMFNARGISLHTRNIDFAARAAQYGIAYVEHHFALDGTLHSDREYSLSPEELANLAARVGVRVKQREYEAQESLWLTGRS